ncbi:2-phospho-L-lactate transferase [Achromobacter pestifer]|uniref:2-phospho-L-lactate transferase n=1 Tax=Achromobacter pestifer TaxID=1353889 RepID=A0A7D4HZW4_9BURK|nr:2-phospho-L-lactate transferase [Achromobacter pestifer]QKH36196.1 2-phospho-L-lactate transferase [Achromobacter pestifer]
MSDRSAPLRIVLLAGGVGGARMAVGLSAEPRVGQLTVIANVGDDDWFHGLRVCPDIDTITYTLAGLVNREQGWGLAGDTAGALATLRTLGSEDTWMSLGDRDIGLHIFRSHRLRQGHPLSSITRAAAHALGVSAAILPATDSEVPTIVSTAEGRLRFQQWFVERRAKPAVASLEYAGAGQAMPAPGVREAIACADLIVIAPSNPLLSIHPMLAIPGMRTALAAASASIVAVSPLLRGAAVKGPLAALAADLHFPPGNLGIARMYDGLVDAMVIDHGDAADQAGISGAIGVPVLCAHTLIADAASATRLASTLISWAGTRRGEPLARARS